METASKYCLQRLKVFEKAIFVTLILTCQDFYRFEGKWVMFSILF